MVHAGGCQNLFTNFIFFVLGDKGKSNKPARILLVGTHGESCKKNVVGEFTSATIDKVIN